MEYISDRTKNLPPSSFPHFDRSNYSVVYSNTIELKLNNDNLKSCLHEARIQAQFEIILIFARASTNRPNTKHEL